MDPMPPKDPPTQPEPFEDTPGKNLDPSLRPHPPAPIDPRLALPVHLQGIPYDEDIWDRMARSPIRSPVATQRAVREDAEIRDLVRSALAAGAEREKEILLHHQARLFHTMLQAIGERLKSVLNTPLTPKSWQNPTKDTIDKADESSTSKSAKEWASFLLTPKVFLTIVALAFGVIAGYSRVQVYNLNETIAAYEKSNTALKSSVESIEKRTSEITAERETFNKKLADAERRLRDEENKRLMVDQSLIDAKSDRDSARKEIDGLRTELAEARKGSTEQEKTLREQLASAQTNLASVRAELAKESTKAEAAVKTSEIYKKSADEFKELLQKSQSQITSLQSSIDQKEIDLAKSTLQTSLIPIAEECIREIRKLCESHRQIRTSEILDLVEKYDQRKERLQK